MRCLGRGKGQRNIYLTTVWLSPECQHFYASSESKYLLGNTRGHLLEEQIFHESFIPVCLTVLSAVPEPAAVVCPPVAQFFGILGLSLSAHINHPYISGECGMRLQVKNTVEGALELWLSFLATFSPRDFKQVLSPSPRARLWGL